MFRKKGKKCPTLKLYFRCHFFQYCHCSKLCCEKNSIVWDTGHRFANKENEKMLRGLTIGYPTGNDSVDVVCLVKGSHSGTRGCDWS